MEEGLTRFEDHIRSRKAQPPSVVYKYTTVDTARAILSTGKVRFQSPVRYNDPFDSQWDPLWQLSTAESRKIQCNLIEQALRDPTSWPKNSCPEFRDAMKSTRAELDALPVEQRDQAIKDLATDAFCGRRLPDSQARRSLDLRRRLRVFCVSATDTSLLMWSHYADQHRGVVLGFDALALERGWPSPCPLEPVDYRDGPPELIQDVGEFFKQLFFGVPHAPPWDNWQRETVLAKHSHWSYEREWRTVCIEKPGVLGDYSDYAFPRNALVELTTGCRTDEVRADELRSLAYPFSSDMKFFAMRKHLFRLELGKLAISAGE